MNRTVGDVIAELNAFIARGDECHDVDQADS